jgi:hypothetical protein
MSRAQAATAMFITRSKAVNMRAATALCIVFATMVSGAQTTQHSSAIVVLPFQTISFARKDAKLFLDATRGKLNGLGLMTRTLAAADTAPQAVCGEIACADSVADALDAHFAVFGSLGAVGELFTMTVSVYDARSDTLRWSGQFNLRGAIEDFFLAAPPRAADSIHAIITRAQNVNEKATPSARPASSAPETASEEPAIVIEEADSRDENAEYPIEIVTTRSARDSAERESQSIDGIVSAPSFGISGRGAISDLYNNSTGEQSDWSAAFYYLHPTTKRSHLRILGSIPLSIPEAAQKRTDQRQQDLLFALEHEWGLRYFGIGVGLTYSYLPPFSKSDKVNTGYGDSLLAVAAYDRSHLTGLSISIRGGLPHKCFHGKFSYPFPFYLNRNAPKNSHFELSLLGVFGSPRIKGAAGFEMAKRNREADRVVAYRQNDTTAYDYSDSYHYSYNTYYDSYDDFDSWLTESESYYAMLPVAKLAFLLAKHHVFVIGMDLGGILFPRIDGFGNPSLVLQYGFSFGELDEANALDGKL